MTVSIQVEADATGTVDTCTSDQDRTVVAGCGDPEDLLSSPVAPREPAEPQDRLLAEADRSSGRVFNIGSAEEVAIIALAGRVIERTGSRSAIRLVPYADAYGPGFEELGRRRPDTRALEELTGWLPSRTLDEAIDEVAAYERSLSEQDQSLRLVG